MCLVFLFFFFFFQAEDGIRDRTVTGVQTCALPILAIDTVDDLARLFREIPLDRVSTSMTINATAGVLLAMYVVVARSEERRVGKECRCRWAPEHGKKKRGRG